MTIFSSPFTRFQLPRHLCVQYMIVERRQSIGNGLIFRQTILVMLEDSESKGCALGCPEEAENSKDPEEKKERVMMESERVK